MTELLLLGAKYRFVELTTTDLGKNIMKSIFTHIAKHHNAIYLQYEITLLHAHECNTIMHFFKKNNHMGIINNLGPMQNENES